MRLCFMPSAMASTTDWLAMVMKDDSTKDATSRRSLVGRCSMSPNSWQNARCSSAIPTNRQDCSVELHHLAPLEIVVVVAGRAVDEDAVLGSGVTGDSRDPWLVGLPVDGSEMLTPCSAGNGCGRWNESTGDIA